MTFQKAATILKADAGTHTDADKQKAINTVKWYEDNQLELEDYETNELHVLLEKIYKLEELKSRPQRQINSDIALEHAATLSKTMRTITLQNDLINHIPDPKKLSDKDVYANYHYLSVALDNIFELNQHLNNDLDKVAAYFYDIAEELEDQANESN